MKYIDVVLNIPLNQSFTYMEPEKTENEIQIENPFGLRVEVRFGNRTLTGIVVNSYDELPKNYPVPKEKIRHATKYKDKEPLITQELFELAKFMSSYYVAAIGECLFSMIPSGKKESKMPGFSFQETEESFEKKLLSDEQQEAVKNILEHDEKTLFHYLYGKTGSGKTEVFLSVADKMIEQKKGVIYLVPEIGLTPQVIEAVVKRFGNTAAVLHSELTPNQKLTEWKRIMNKEALVVIGARSAIFAPVPNLGLIIIDEEHDSSYKSGSSPRYHARQIAMRRASLNKIPLLMGSATPSVEAYYSMQQNIIKKHVLTKRLAGGKMPEIKCINLSAKKNNGECISKELAEQIIQTLAQKRQVILFLNRRGFTHFFRCTTCGYELKCKNCSVPLTYHKNENRLRCHYCGYNVSPPQECPECGSLDVGYNGFGTEYIEAEVRAKFPNAKTVRIDTDNLHHKGELQEKIEEFKNGKYDILLGTQMVAKGLNFPSLQLVGVILADTALHLPDFRACEKTFALITQVAGRAGRFFPDGKVLVQSFSPERKPIDCAVKNKIEEFYDDEIETRKLLNFPPFSRLLRFVYRSADQKAALKASEDAAKILLAMNENSVQLLGPAECPLNKISSNYRYQILLRGASVQKLQSMAQKLAWGYKGPQNVYMEIDVDPVSML